MEQPLRFYCLNGSDLRNHNKPKAKMLLRPTGFTGKYFLTPQGRLSLQGTFGV